jgi:cytochrome o ubiquinol oxidase subunit 1
VGTLLPGINAGHHHQDARTGMGMMKMPIFTWTALCTNILIVASFPVSPPCWPLLSMDRYLGTVFLLDFGGNSMMYVNLIWIWGHPEVYIRSCRCSACFRSR